MPSAQAHLQQARANRDYANRLLQPDTSEPIVLQWAVTVAFYAAVHCMEAHLARYDIHSTTHIKRRNAMNDARFGIPAGVRTAYDALRWNSEDARYEMRQFSLQDIRERVIGRDLAVITTFVNL